MARLIALIAGVASGVLLAGISAGLLVPRLPPAWRTAPMVWGVAASVMALAIGIAFRVSRPRRN